MLPFGGCGRKKQVTAQKAGVLKPEAPGKEVLDHGEAVVDISNVAQGYVARDIREVQRRSVLK